MPADAYEPLPCSGMPCPDDCTYPQGPCAYLVDRETASREPQPQLSSTSETQADLYRDNQRLYAERQALEDRCVALQRERDEAITALGIASRAQGLAEGKMEASETAGVVDGWKRRAEAAEAQRDALLAVARAARQGVQERADEARWDYLILTTLDALPPEVREMVDQS